MERKINMEDAAIFRIQAFVETILKMQCEIASHLSNRPFDEILEMAVKEIDVATKELITIHSSLGSSREQN